MAKSRDGIFIQISSTSKGSLINREGFSGESQLSALGLGQAQRPDTLGPGEVLPLDGLMGHKCPTATARALLSECTGLGGGCFSIQDQKFGVHYQQNHLKKIKNK